MDDQITEVQDDRLSFIDAFRQLVQYAELDQAKKEYFLNLLTDARYSSMTPEDATELIGIVEKTQDQLEQKIIDSNDPEVINGLTELKSFTYTLLNEAEEKGYRLFLGGTVGESSGDNKTGQWLLDKFAGIQ